MTREVEEMTSEEPEMKRSLRSILDNKKVFGESRAAQ
jgi:hypothetical protein